MNYDWYQLFDLSDFTDADLVSRTLLILLEGRGPTVFEIFRGNYVSIQYDDAFLPVNILDQNPYVQGAYAVYLDSNDIVWFGFEVAE